MLLSSPKLRRKLNEEFSLIENFSLILSQEIEHKAPHICPKVVVIWNRYCTSIGQPQKYNYDAYNRFPKNMQCKYEIIELQPGWH